MISYTGQAYHTKMKGFVAKTEGGVMVSILT